MEHCISEISRVSRDRGHLLVTTPNLMTIPPHPVNDEHLGYVSTSNLRKICDKHGYKFLNHVGSSFKFPLVRLGNKIPLFYDFFDVVTRRFNDPLKVLTQTIVMTFMKRAERTQRPGPKARQEEMVHRLEVAQAR